VKDYRNLKIKLVAEAVDFIGSIFFFGSRNKNIVKEQIKKIVLLKFDRLGDTFLSLPAVEAIKSVYSNSELIVLCASWNRQIFENNQSIDELICLDEIPDVHGGSIFSFFKLGKIKKIANKLRELKPDLVLDLQGNPMNVLAMFFSGARIRVGFANKILSFLLTHSAGYELAWHQSKDFLALAEKIGYRGDRPWPKMIVSDKEKSVVQEILEENYLTDFIVFHLSAGRSYRQWPIDSFIDLANKIIDNTPDGLELVIIGVSGDKELSGEFTKGINDKKRIIDLSGRMNIKESYYFLSKAECFIGNDSGPGHFAGALDVPTITFMNAWTTIERWLPLGRKVKVFYRKAHKCSGQFCHLIPCPNMSAITVEEAYKYFLSTYENTSNK